MGCMNLSLLVKAWVLLKLVSITLIYKINCLLFLCALRLFLFYLSFKECQLFKYFESKLYNVYIYDINLPA